MELPAVLLLVAVGCVAGFLAGLFGVGGGIILVPLLLWFYSEMLGVSGQVAAHLSLGTSLFIVALTSVSSAARHYRNGNVILNAALVIGLTSIVAALGGAHIASGLPGETLMRVFAVILAITAVVLVADNRAGKQRKEISPQTGTMVLTGGLTGLLSALTGLGGGILSIPMMVSLMGFPLKKAVGTSSATIVLTAAAAAIGYVHGGLHDPDLAPYHWFTLGYVDYIHSLPIIVGTLPAASLGAHLANETKNILLKRLFSLFLLVVAARIFFY